MRHLHSATDTIGKVGVISTTNTTVDVVLNGETKNPTMTGRAGDGEGAPTDSADSITNPAYSGAVSFTGLTANTTYSFTVTQGGVTETGTLHTSPARRFTLWQLTCDGLHTALPFPDKDSPTKYMYGMWPTIRADAENTSTPDVVGILFPDDLGYRDAGWVDDEAGTGIYSKIQPKKMGVGAETEYSFVVADLAYLGLLTDFSYTGYESTKMESKGLRQNQFYHEDRFWCFQNIGFYPGRGDHETAGNQGEGAADTQAMKDTALDSSIYMMGIGAPDPLNSGTNGYCYVHTIGPCQIITFDREYNNGTPGGSNSFDTSTQLPTGEDFLSTAQIDLLTAAIDTTSATPFKIISSPSDCHYGCNEADRVAYIGTPGAVLAGSIGMGHQQPIEGYGNGLVEWERLMTHNGDVTTEGILQSGIDNDFQTLWLSGDRHYYGAKVHFRPAHDDDCEENLLQLYSGSVNGKTAQQLANIVRSSHKSFQGSGWVYIPDWVDQVKRPQHPSAIRIEVRQDLSPMEINLRIYDIDEGIVFETTMIEGEGNIPADLNYLKGIASADSNGD